MQTQFERELLKALKSIDGTLKRIEKSMDDEEKQHTTIYNAVSHALNGKKYKPIHSDAEPQSHTQISDIELLQ